MNSLATNLPSGLTIGVTLCLTCILTIISVVDLKTLRIPDILSLPLIATGLALAFSVPAVNAEDNVIGALAAYVLFAGLGEIYFRSRGIDGLGLGDAKLFAGVGAWLGWQALPMVLLCATVGCLIGTLAFTKAIEAKPIAFGPYIAAAFWLVWIWSCLA